MTGARSDADRTQGEEPITRDGYAEGRQGTLLRRVGLLVAGTWALVVILTLWSGFTRPTQLDATSIARVLRAATVSTWGYLGAAVFLYVAGVSVALRVSAPPNQVPFRLRLVTGHKRGELLPILAIGLAVVAFTVAIIEQRSNNETNPLHMSTSAPRPVREPALPATPEAAHPTTTNEPVVGSCAPFQMTEPASLHPSPVNAVVAGRLAITDPRAGTGRVVRLGDRITVHYALYACSTGLQIEASTTQDAVFNLSDAELMEGWVVGIPGMKVGGIRQLTVPPELAYGATGTPPSIAPNETLVFVVEMLEAEPAVR